MIDFKWGFTWRVCFVFIKKAKHLSYNILYVITVMFLILHINDKNMWFKWYLNKFLLRIPNITLFKSPKQSLGDLLFLLRFFLLSLPNKVWRLIVFAPFLLIIIIILILILILLSFRAPWTCPRQISGTTGQNFMKHGGVIDICF